MQTSDDVRVFLDLNGECILQVGVRREHQQELKGTWYRIELSNERYNKRNRLLRKITYIRGMQEMKIKTG